MNTLKIDTGLVTYKLNDVCEVSFNPTDANFIEGIYRTFADLDRKQKDYQAERESIGDDADKLFEFMNAKDAEMRSMIDSVFNVSVCDTVFNGVSVFALNRSGMPLWASLLFAIIDECDVEAKALSKQGSETVQKYIKKYKK